jgi:hypothetical protein
MAAYNETRQPPYHKEETVGLQDIITAVRDESGTQEGHCPLCDSAAFDDDTGMCADCGVDLLRDWELGMAETVAEDRR